jgi:AcrR family transcriptional regulator
MVTMATLMTVVPGKRVSRYRSDARRSIDAIVAAATTVLGERPDASMEEIAALAGVTRQTVYAHFPSRDALIAAVIEAVRAVGLAAIREEGLDTAAPAVAIRRFLDISWQLVYRDPVVLDPAVGRMVGSEAHGPDDVVRRFLVQLIRRGQRTGDVDRGLPAPWLATATFSLGHAVALEVAAGRLTASKAATILEASVARLCGLAQAP